MSRSRKVILIAGGATLLLIVTLSGLWLALQSEPKFYHEALAVDVQSREQASDETLQHMAAFFSDLQKPGKWQAHFTAEQLNGWLAVDMAKNHPHALPPNWHDPRVSIESGKIIIACRYEWSVISTVLTLTLKPSMTEENSLALRIERARAGILPLPLGGVIKNISEAARQSELRLEWRQIDGDPVALISFSPPETENDLLIKMRSLRIEAGEYFLSGVTERQK